MRRPPRGPTRAGNGPQTGAGEFSSGRIVGLAPVVHWSDGGQAAAARGGHGSVRGRVARRRFGTDHERARGVEW